MEFDREVLLEGLERAAPALATEVVIPSLCHYWFDKANVYAFDGYTGVKLKLASDLVCGLPGKQMTDLLKTSSLGNVTLTTNDEFVELKMGRSRLKLASLPAEDQIWPFPKTPPKDGVPVLPITSEVHQALKRLLFTRLTREVSTIHKGVLAVPVKDGLELYSSDSRSIARVVVPCSVPKGMTWFMMSWAFVNRLLTLGVDTVSLHMREDCLLAEAKGAMICSTLLDISDLPDVPHTLAAYLDESEKKTALPLGLKRSLSRAAILAGQDQPILTISVEGSKMTLKGQYALGALDDAFEIKGSLKGQGQFQADLIERALDYAKTFVMTEEAFTVYDDDFVYLVAAHARQS